MYAELFELPISLDNQLLVSRSIKTSARPSICVEGLVSDLWLTCLGDYLQALLEQFGAFDPDSFDEFVYELELESTSSELNIDAVVVLLSDCLQNELSETTVAAIRPIIELAHAKHSSTLTVSDPASFCEELGPVVAVNTITTKDQS